MSRAFVYLFCVFTVGAVHGQETTTTAPPISDVQTSPPTNSSSSDPALNSTDTLSDEYPAWEPPEELPDPISSFDIPEYTKTKHTLKPVAVHFLQKLSDWTRPVYEKFSKITGLLAHPYHPNYGGTLAPQQVWEKWHEKGHHFLTGIHGAVFGVAPLENHDYPFAYRGLKDFSEKKSVKS